MALPALQSTSPNQAEPSQIQYTRQALHLLRLLVQALEVRIRNKDTHDVCLPRQFEVQKEFQKKCGIAPRQKPG
jgi:hypothetical protein